MHKLDRASVAAPGCLATYDYQSQSWDDLAGECKRQLRAALVKMQGIPGVTTADANEYGVRCAYCEGAIHHEGHIEHFRRKNPAHYPELSFAWENLFLVCGSHKLCGHYKDRKDSPPYDPDQLIKPDVHDPGNYLYLHSSGEVRVRKGLNPGDAKRATETIRVFGMNNRTLVGSRAKAMTFYKKKMVADLDVLAAWSPADRRAYLEEEIEATRYAPYSTTIQHFLQSAA